jgi:hypothetical protein
MTDTMRTWKSIRRSMARRLDYRSTLAVVMKRPSSAK